AVRSVVRGVSDPGNHGTKARRRRSEEAIIDVERQGRVDVIAYPGDPLETELPLGVVDKVAGRERLARPDTDAIVQGDRADTAADMRRKRPADAEVVDQVAHDGIGIAITGRRQVKRPDAEAALAVLLEAEFLFEAPRAPFVA